MNEIESNFKKTKYQNRISLNETQNMTMKKLTTLLVAMLLTAGMAFGQSNNATVDQNGNGNDIVADQNGSFNDVMLLQQVKNNQAAESLTGNHNLR